MAGLWGGGGVGAEPKKGGPPDGPPGRRPQASAPPLGGAGGGGSGPRDRAERGRGPPWAARGTKRGGGRTRGQPAPGGGGGAQGAARRGRRAAPAGRLGPPHGKAGPEPRDRPRNPRTGQNDYFCCSFRRKLNKSRVLCGTESARSGGGCQPADNRHGGPSQGQPAPEGRRGPGRAVDGRGAAGPLPTERARRRADRPDGSAAGLPLWGRQAPT